MKNTTNLKYAKVFEDYFGHNGAIYKGETVIVKEIKSDKIRIETMTGKIYWLNPKILKIT